MEQPVSVEGRIILATISCIQKYDIAGATNRQVAAEADVNIAASNYYFRSKDNLIRQVMHQALVNAFRYEDFIGFPNATPRERCRGFFKHLVKDGSDYPVLTRAHFHELMSSSKYEAEVVT